MPKFAHLPSGIRTSVFVRAHSAKTIVAMFEKILTESAETKLWIRSECYWRNVGGTKQGRWVEILYIAMNVPSNRSSQLKTVPRGRGQ